MYRYSVTVTHQGLGKIRVLTGYDNYVLHMRANELKDRWNEQYATKLRRDQAVADKAERKQHLEDSITDARERTEEARKERASLESLLVDSLEVPAFEWASLKRGDGYTVPPPTPPVYQAYPPEPTPVSPHLGLFDKVFASRKRHKEQLAARETELNREKWSSVCKEIEKHNDDVLALCTAQMAEWEKGREDHQADRDAQWAAIDQQRTAYESDEEAGVTSLCEIVLSRTDHPNLPSPDFELQFNPEAKALIIEYSLPSPEAMPRLKEIRYIKTRDEFSELAYTDSEQSRLYDNVVYQICLRVLSDVFRADKSAIIAGVTFNGWVTSVDPAKGKEATVCIVSVTAQRGQFLEIDLARVDPKACFKSLKGVGSSKLHGVAAIAPLCTISREDSRFIQAHDVAETLAEGYNLATMDWEEFEQLIREVFEKEFSTNGGECKVTQASRDGGVDAIAFDPDPIRGGKIVIQAKRYTNTVGVAAVRDLYGTVMNEGANKGILVTTADYGPDAYHFAADKPLTLLNGANLLHLLEKHGHTVRIDLREAKKISAATDPRYRHG